MSVNRLMAMTLAATALFGGASTAVAQGRDAGDRGQRLERDEMRNDIRQHRLETAPFPQLAPQPSQAAPKAKGRGKSKRSGSGKTP
jgi:hypothetical protein